MSHLTDDQLLQRFAEGRDAEAFAGLVGRHMGLVHATCRRETGDEILAEDAAQATFLLLARKARSLRGERSLASWLFVVARGTAQNLVREERRRKAREARAFRPETTMNDDREALEPRLNDALARLSAKDRQAVILRYLEDRSPAEVATELGLGESAARMRVSRALERLRKGLGRAGVAVSATALVAFLARDAQAATPPGFAARLLAVSAPPAASPGAGTGAWPLLAKGISLTLATTTTKALALSGAALVLAGGFVAYTHQAVDDATVRAAFRPLAGTWKGTAQPPGQKTPTPIQVEFRPQREGLGLRFTVKFPDLHEGNRSDLSIDPRTGKLVMAENGREVVYAAEGLRDVARRGRGGLVFVGPPATHQGLSQMRFSLDVDGDRMKVRQELRPFKGPPQIEEMSLVRA